MVIDCESCAVRFSACGECVVGVLLGMPPGAPTVSLDAPERQALDVLAEQGLVPRLRLVATRPVELPHDAHGTEHDRDVG
jgi:hypothetical protein